MPGHSRSAIQSVPMYEQLEDPDEYGRRVARELFAEYLRDSGHQTATKPGASVDSEGSQPRNANASSENYFSAAASPRCGERNA